MLKSYLQTFSKAILAGLLIGVAGTIYLVLFDSYHLMGVMMFGFGLLVILAQGYNLYTGKVGYLIDNKPRFMIDLLIMIIGNAVGTTIIAAVVIMADVQVAINVANDLIDYKMAHAWWQVLGLSILCGMLMYIAAEGYRRIANDIARVFIVLFAVAIFLLGRFEHSIADMFYFTIALRWNGMTFFYFILMIIGNGLGSIIINFFEKIAKLKENVCPVSYYDEVKKEPKPKNPNIPDEPHNFN